MNLKNIITSLVFVASLSFSFGATTVNLLFNNNSGPFVMPDGSSPLTDNSTIAWGVFDTTAFGSLSASQYDYTNISSIFTSYGSLAITGGQIAVTGINLTGGSQGDQLSVFVYTPDFSSIAVFSSTNSLWDYPADPGLATLGNLADIAYLGQINSGSPKTFQLVTAVPEPSTYAAIFGALALGFVAYRRRRS